MSASAYVPEHGDFVQRHDGNSNVHIVKVITPDCDDVKVTVACGGSWYSSALRHVSEQAALGWRKCHKCWAAM